MKVIFLDIDGVLNSIDTMLAFPDKPHPRSEELDQVSVNLIKRLCTETNAKIVISSTWRKLYSRKEFLEIFERYGWPFFPIIGVTDSYNSHGQTRGHEIQRWLDVNSDVEYIILDDDSDMLESQMDRFVHCSNVNGFRSKHYCKAMRLFGYGDEQLELQVNWKKEKTEYD